MAACPSDAPAYHWDREAADGRRESPLAGYGRPRNALDNAHAEALADAGVYRAIQELLEPKSKGVLGPQIENLLKLASGPAAARRRIERDLKSQLGQSSNPDLEDMFVDGWRTDGTVHAWSFDEGRVLISIEDESGKIDLNTAADALLHGLFLSVGLDDQASSALVDAIVDFRDEDDLRRLNGAEDRPGRSPVRGRSRRPRSRPRKPERSGAS